MQVSSHVTSCGRCLEAEASTNLNFMQHKSIGECEKGWILWRVNHAEVLCTIKTFGNFNYLWIGEVSSFTQMIGSVPAIGMLYDTLIFLLAIHGFQVIQHGSFASSRGCFAGFGTDIVGRWSKLTTILLCFTSSWLDFPTVQLSLTILEGQQNLISYTAIQISSHILPSKCHLIYCHPCWFSFFPACPAHNRMLLMTHGPFFTNSKGEKLHQLFRWRTAGELTGARMATSVAWNVDKLSRFVWFQWFFCLVCLSQKNMGRSKLKNI